MSLSLLYLQFSPRTDSASTALGDHFLSEWKANNPSAHIITRQLGHEPIEGPSEDWILANMCAGSDRNPTQQKLLASSDAAIQDISLASHILITTPMFNFSIPWHLKAYIDNIVRVNETFSFDPETGFAPLLDPSKKLKVIWTSAGTYQAGTPFHAFDQLTPYLQTVFGFMGIGNTSFVSAGGMWATPEEAEASLASARAALSNDASNW